MGKIPRDLFEDELVPLFEKAGTIWDLRLMMDPLSGLNRGYAFVTYCTKESAQQAVKLVCMLHCNYDTYYFTKGTLCCIHFAIILQMHLDRLFLFSIY